MNPRAMPGMTTERAYAPRQIFATMVGAQYLPSGKIISGAGSRDPLNTGDINVLRAGLVMGKITASGKYGPSIIGQTAAAYDGSTTITVSAATATEIVRRIGATGTFKITGPPSAAGVVRTCTVTYSAVDTSSGEITVTALNVAGVQTVTMVGTLSAGAFTLSIEKPDGSIVRTAAQAYNVSIADLKTAVDTAVGAADKLTIAGDSIASFTATQGGTWVGSAAGIVSVDIVTALTGLTASVITQTTAAVDGAFVTKSLVQPTTGEEVCKGLLCEETGVKVTDDDNADIDVQMPMFAIGGVIDVTQIIDYPADASLKTWLKSQLKAACPTMVFSDDF